MPSSFIEVPLSPSARWIAHPALRARATRPRARRARRTAPAQARAAAELERLTTELAPDLSARILALVREVDPEVFGQLAPLAPATGVMALAARPAVDARAVLADARDTPVVMLEDPRDLGNMGACVRVAAAADV